MLTARISEVVPERKEADTDVLMFVIQYFPMDMTSLQSLLTLSKSFNRNAKKNDLLWVSSFCSVFQILMTLHTTLDN